MSLTLLDNCNFSLKVKDKLLLFLYSIEYEVFNNDNKIYKCFNKMLKDNGIDIEDHNNIEKEWRWYKEVVFRDMI